MANDDLLKAMTDVVTTIPNAIQDLNNEAIAIRYIKRLLNGQLKDDTASRLLPVMCKFYEGANLSENTKKELFKSIRDKANHLEQKGLLTDELRDQVYGLMNKTGERRVKPLELTSSPPPQTGENLGIPPSARSSSNASSSYASEDTSSSVGSDSSNKSGDSIASSSSFKSVLNTLEKLVVSRRGYPTGKGSEPQEDQKGPTKSPPSCTAGIKKALSSCCSYLSNGLRSVCDSFTNKNMQKYANLDKDLPRDPKATPTRARTSNNANRTNAGNPSQNSGNSFFSSLRAMMLRSETKTTSSIGGLASERTSVHFTTFKNSNGRWVSREAGSITVPTATDIGNAAISGTRSFANGLASVGRTTFGVAEFMAKPGESSSMTWVELIKSVRDSTRGMSSDNEYGVRVAAKDAVVFTRDALKETPEALIPGKGAAKFAGYLAGSIASGGAIILSSKAIITLPTSLTR